MTDLIIKLKKPVKFEGEEITEINLTGLEDLTGIDGINAQRLFKKRNPESVVVAAYSLEPDYCLILAEKASGLPLSFFEQAPINVGNKVTSTVTAFLNRDSDE